MKEECEEPDAVGEPTTSLAVAVPLKAAEGEEPAEADGNNVALLRALPVSLAADSEGCGVAQTRAVALAVTQLLLEMAPVAVPAELPLPAKDAVPQKVADDETAPVVVPAKLPLPSKDAVPQKVADNEAAPLEDSLRTTEKELHADAVEEVDALGRLLREAGIKEGDAHTVALAERLTPRVPEGDADKWEVRESEGPLVADEKSASEGVAGGLFDKQGEAESVDRAVKVGAPEMLLRTLAEARAEAEKEGLGDADEVADIEPEGLREGAAETEKGGEVEGVAEKDSAADAVVDLEAERVTEEEAVALREKGAEAVTEWLELPSEDADALRRADALAPPTVALTRAVPLIAPLAEAHIEARPVKDSSADADGEAVLSTLTLADEEIDSTAVREMLPLSDSKAVEEAVPRPAPAEPLPLGEPLAVALSVPPAAVCEGPADGVAGGVALGGPESEPTKLLELLGEAESRAEEEGVTSIPLGLAETDADAGAVKESKPLGVSKPLAEAAMVMLSAGDREAPVLREGGGERLKEGLRVDDWEALALTVPQREVAAEGLSDGLCEGAREVDGDEVGCPDGETKAVTEAEWHPLALADGERDTRALPLPRPLRLELPVSLAERASVLLPVAVSSGDGEGRGEREGTADAHEVAEAKIVCVSRPDRVSAGEDEALFSVLPDGTDVGDASCDRVVEEDAQIEPEGDPEALSRALGDADPHSDAASAVGVPTPLAVALLLPEGPTVGLPKGDCVAEVLVRAVPLPPEVCECEPLALAQELPVGKPAEGDNEEVGVPASLLVFKGVPLPPEVCVCEPLALAQGLPVGKPAEGEEEEVGVPASLLVLKGVLDAVSRTVRDGAAFVGVSQAVEVVLAAGDGDAEKVGRVVDEGE